MNSDRGLHIGVVGPCKSGKSTLVRGLQQAGYEASQISQEHSFAPQMWEQISKPDILVYLDCNYETTVSRGLKWMRSEYEDERPRLAHAREHADLEISTNDVPAEDVLQQVLTYIQAGKTH